MWGSLGAAAGISGKLFTINPNIVFWMTSVFSFFLIAFLLLMRGGDSNKSEEQVDIIKLKDILSLLYNRSFWIFLIYVLGVACVYSVYDQQFPVYYASLFSSVDQGNQMYGYLSSIQVFLKLE